MDLNLEANADKEADGFNGNITMYREEVEDIYQLANLFTDFAVACGFTYVKAVGFEKDDGTVVWGDF